MGACGSTDARGGGGGGGAPVESESMVSLRDERLPEPDEAAAKPAVRRVLTARLEPVPDSDSDSEAEPEAGAEAAAGGGGDETPDIVFEEYERFHAAWKRRRWRVFVPSAYAERRDAFEALAARLEPHAARGDESSRVLLPTLRQEVLAYGSRPWLYDTTERGGLHLALDHWCRSRRFAAPDAIDALEEGARDFAAAAEELAAAWGASDPSREGLARPHAEALARQLRGMAGRDPSAGAFLSHGMGLPAARALFSRRPELRERAVAAVRDVLQPALLALAARLEADVVPRARAEPALPPELFRCLVDAAAGATPEQAFEAAEREVERLKGEITLVCERMGVRPPEGGGFAALTSVIEDDPRFFFRRGDDVVGLYLGALRRAVGELPRHFAWLPPSTLQVRSKRSSTAASAYYSAGTSTLVVNVFRPEARPGYMVSAICAHEGVGHHVQLQRARAVAGSLPPFRQRRGAYLAFSEGWAVYVEGLLRDVYGDDPMQELGRLNGEILRAGRVVVSVGLHARGWTRARARDWLDDHTVLSDYEVDSEVLRASLDPAHAMAYTVGALKFRELRERAAARLGPRMSVPAFHEAVLRGGSMPLAVLDDLFSEWLERVAADAGRDVDGKVPHACPPVRRARRYFERKKLR